SPVPRDPGADRTRDRLAGAGYRAAQDGGASTAAAELVEGLGVAPGAEKMPRGDRRAAAGHSGAGFSASSATRSRHARNRAHRRRAEGSYRACPAAGAGGAERTRARPVRHRRANPGGAGADDRRRHALATAALDPAELQRDRMGWRNAIG